MDFSFCKQKGIAFTPVNTNMDKDTLKHIEEFANIAADEDIRVASKISTTEAALGCVACCAFGLGFGLIGFTVGGIIGGTYAFKMTRQNVRPLKEFLHEMTEKQQRQLVKKVKEAVAMSCACKTNPKDMIRTIVLTTVTNYVSGVLNMQIIDNDE